MPCTTYGGIASDNDRRETSNGLITMLVTSGKFPVSLTFCVQAGNDHACLDPASILLNKLDVSWRWR